MNTNRGHTCCFRAKTDKAPKGSSYSCSCQSPFIGYPLCTLSEPPVRRLQPACSSAMSSFSARDESKRIASMRHSTGRRPAAAHRPFKVDDGTLSLSFLTHFSGALRPSGTWSACSVEGKQIFFLKENERGISSMRKLVFSIEQAPNYQSECTTHPRHVGVFSGLIVIRGRLSRPLAHPRLLLSLKTFS